MQTHDRIIQRFQQLTAEGQEILTERGWDGRKFFRNNPGSGEYLRIRTEALNLVKRTCGEDSDHYQLLKRLAETPESANNGYYLVHCMSAVEAAKRDFEGGFLFDLRALVAAEVLVDFMEQAEILLESGYHAAAASLAGAILEDALRKLCERRNIPVPAKTSIDRLNSDLAKAGAYDKLVQKRITAHADIRNKADHGQFDKFTREDVEDLVK